MECFGVLLVGSPQLVSSRLDLHQRFSAGTHMSWSFSFVSVCAVDVILFQSSQYVSGRLLSVRVLACCDRFLFVSMSLCVLCRFGLIAVHESGSIWVLQFQLAEIELGGVFE